MGGVFWGLTIDARHLFSRLSLYADRLGVKKFYLEDETAAPFETVPQSVRWLQSIRTKSGTDEERN